MAVRRDIILPALIFAIFALLPAIAALTAKQYLIDVGARMMVFAVAAVALDLLVGYAGLISFGHAAFIGLGAYAVGILSTHGMLRVRIKKYSRGELKPVPTWLWSLFLASVAIAIIAVSTRFTV